MAKAFLKLTRLAIRKLGTGQILCEHGIAFKRLPDGDGVYTINIMVDGTRIHRVVGKESEGTTRTQAEEYIEKIRRDARDNRLSLPKGRKVALTFKAAATQYIERLKQEGGKNIDTKGKQLERHITPFFENTPLSRISSFDIERYKKHRLEQKRLKRSAKKDKHGKETPAIYQATHKATVNRELAVLSHLLNKAHEWGWIDRRAVKINRFREEQGRITYLTPEQAETLREAAKHDQNPQIYPFILIGLETGMRRAEILSIRLEHVDANRRCIFIPKAKAGAREQPLTAHLADYLKSYIKMLPKGAEWLFPSPGAKNGHAVDVRKPFRRVVAAAELDPDKILRHTLRHTAITHLVQAGVDLPTVKRISGHKTLAMVERYAHQNGTHIQTAMDKLEARYGLNEAEKSPKTGVVAGTITPKLHKAS